MHVNKKSHHKIFINISVPQKKKFERFRINIDKRPYLFNNDKYLQGRPTSERKRKNNKKSKENSVKQTQAFKKR